MISLKLIKEYLSNSLQWLKGDRKAAKQLYNVAAPQLNKMGVKFSPLDGTPLNQKTISFMYNADDVSPEERFSRFRDYWKKETDALYDKQDKRRAKRRAEDEEAYQKRKAEREAAYKRQDDERDASRAAFDKETEERKKAFEAEKQKIQDELDAKIAKIRASGRDNVAQIEANLERKKQEIEARYQDKLAKIQKRRNNLKPIVIVSPFICDLFSVFINVGAITLFPFIITRKPMSDQLLNHESIHIKQQMELLVIGFYALYVWYWAKSLLKGKTPSEAYYGLPFERET